MRMHHDLGPIIQCELRVFSLDDHPTYAASSYCWTKELQACQILLNGQKFFVRPNLYAYLEIMKLEQRTCWIFY